jgi:hypothetical protein
MLKYETLSSERYLMESLEHEQRQLRREYNRKSVRDFTTFLVGLFSIAAGIFAAQTLPQWLPAMKKLLHVHFWPF